MVIPARIHAVSEERDRHVRIILLEHGQCPGLVPALGHNIDADLAASRRLVVCVGVNEATDKILPSGSDNPAQLSDPSWQAASIS